jgi:tRNA pseudouridine55 synthase
MIDGILLIDKEEGISSYDVIRKVKKIVGKGEKIGHSGTLDPFASGLLILMFGRATKLMNTILSLKKRYTVQGVFGISTDTQDITGNVLHQNSKIPSIEDIQDIIENNFIGNILQTPPLFSAKKIDGKRAYEIARDGGTAQLKPKEVTVYEFDILKYGYPTIECSIVCSSGTYIRTLINDLGIKLDTFATAKSLRRNSIGSFTVDDSINSKDIDENILNTVIDISKVKEILENE